MQFHLLNLIKNVVNKDNNDYKTKKYKKKNIKKRMNKLILN